MKKFIQIYGIAFLFVAIYSIIKLPVIRLDFTSLFTVLSMFFIIAGILDMMLDKGDRTSKLAKNNFYIAILLIVYITVVPFITSSPILDRKSVV